MYIVEIGVGYKRKRCCPETGLRSLVEGIGCRCWCVGAVGIRCNTLLDTLSLYITKSYDTQEVLEQDYLPYIKLCHMMKREV